MGLFLASQFVVGAKVRFEICQSVLCSREQCEDGRPQFGGTMTR